MDLRVGNVELPPFHLWVTTCSFPKFVGIIGTDIITELKAIINWPEKVMNIQIRGKKEQLPITYVNHLQGYAKVHAVSPIIKERKIRKTNQIVVKRKQIVPPFSHMLLECYLRKTPWLNATYYIEADTLHYEGVFIGGAMVKLRENGSFPVPILNMTSSPFVIRTNRLIGIAYTGLCDPDQPSEESPGYMAYHPSQGQGGLGKESKEEETRAFNQTSGPSPLSGYAESLRNRRPSASQEATTQSQQHAYRLPGHAPRRRRYAGDGSRHGQRSTETNKVLEPIYDSPEGARNLEVKDASISNFLQDHDYLSEREYDPYIYGEETESDRETRRAIRKVEKIISLSEAEDEGECGDGSDDPNFPVESPVRLIPTTHPLLNDPDPEDPPCTTEEEYSDEGSSLQSIVVQPYDLQQRADPGPPLSPVEADAVPPQGGEGGLHPEEPVPGPPAMGEFAKQDSGIGGCSPMDISDSPKAATRRMSLPLSNITPWRHLIYQPQKDSS
jgi:hypothetical protein